MFGRRVAAVRVSRHDRGTTGTVTKVSESGNWVEVQFSDGRVCEVCTGLFWYAPERAGLLLVWEADLRLVAT